MSDYLQPGDGPSRIEKFLEEMKGLFREIATEQRRIKDEVTEIRARSADVEGLRRVQDEMRVYTKESVKEGLDRGESRLEDKLANMRSVILTEVDKTIKQTLDEWTQGHIEPLFEQLSNDREERQKRERDEAVQRWRNRITLGTAALLFVVSMYQTFRPKPDNARDYTRPIERLSDIAQ